LRPCQPAQLTNGWIDARDGDKHVPKVEDDWGGEQPVLAVSFDRKLADGLIGAVADKRDTVHHLFGDRQAKFFAECGPMQLDFDSLKLLPLIETSKWTDVPFGDVPDVCVERWQIGEPDFLELSTRAKTLKEAKKMRRTFDHTVHALGLERDDAPQSKTERVLAYLVERGNVGDE
jgi:hypothetical protein